MKPRHRVFIAAVILLALLLNIEQFSAQTGELSPVVINEVMSANRSGLTDEDGDFSDWIELYNRGDRSVNLRDWTLSDDPARPDKWRLPDIKIEPDTYLLIFASGKDKPLHANFKLNDDGEPVTLYPPNSRKFLDASGTTLGEQITDVSWGRVGVAGEYRYLNNPTPGAPNDESIAWIGWVSPVTFSKPHGLFEQPITVTLTTAMPEASIYFTTDGSIPSPESGTYYSVPLHISETTVLRAAAFREGYKPVPDVTASYIFLDDVLTQPAAPSGFPETWGVYGEDAGDGFAQGSPVVADYEMDPEIANHPRYGPALVEALKSLPTLSIATDIHNFDIYANPQERGPDWERPVSVELIEPDTGAGFQLNAGLRIQGGKGRKESMPKHSFRLFFKDEYGPTRLEYPLFPDSPVTSFNTLILRGGVNGSFAGTDQELATYTRDQFLRQSQIEMSGVGSHGIFVHLYLNGLYWGLYNLVERPDAAFAESYLGGDEADWHARNHSGPVSGPGEWTEGVRHNFKHADTPDEKFAAIEPFIDWPQFSDYLIANWYVGNTDWARKNWYFVVQNPQGRAKFFCWDGEKIWTEGAKIDFGSESKTGDFSVSRFFEALMVDADFRLLFADRMYKHLFSDGALTDENSLRRWESMNDAVEMAMIAESARWGDAKFEPPLTQAYWQTLRESVTAQIPKNASKLISLAREKEYYPSIDPPVFNQHGGDIDPGFRLKMSASEADIYYTLDGSDPREAGTGDVSAGAFRYQEPVKLSESVKVKARTRLGGEWSALADAVFLVPQTATSLVISEIMYNPLGGDDFEFIELKNAGEFAFDLSNATFDGISYTFPVDAIIQPGETIVLARDANAFAGRYPGATAYGYFGKNLSNRGETIALKNVFGQTIVSVSYDDESGWPLSPDGRGDSLQLVDFAADATDPFNWAASAEVHGSPGF